MVVTPTLILMLDSDREITMFRYRVSHVTGHTTFARCGVVIAQCVSLSAGDFAI